jgi:hypothetical protein
MTQPKGEHVTHPGTPRDVDLEDWLDGIGFHPANTKAKQVGHQAAREYVANMGAILHEVLPPGRDKTIVFKLLEDVLMRASRALAIGGGPVFQTEEAIAELEKQVAASPISLPRDHRYETEQLGLPVEVPGTPVDEVAQRHQGTVDGQGWETETVGEVSVYRRHGGVLLQTGTSEPVVLSAEDTDDLETALRRARRQAWPF